MCGEACRQREKAESASGERAAVGDALVTVGGREKMRRRGARDYDETLR